VLLSNLIPALVVDLGDGWQKQSRKRDECGNSGSHRFYLTSRIL
jgi:hypothetical protein